MQHPVTNYILAAHQEYNHDLAAVVEKLKTKIEALPRFLHLFLSKKTKKQRHKRKVARS